MNDKPEKAAPSQPEDDRLVLSGGREFRLIPVNMLDSRDFKKQQGQGILQFAASFRTIAAEMGEAADEDPALWIEHFDEETWAFLLWLLIRKDGKSPQEQAAGEWSIPLDEFLALLGPTDVMGGILKAADFLLGSSPSGTEPSSP